MDTCKTLAAYKAGSSQTGLPKPILFCEDRRAVVTGSGSDHRRVYIFDKKKGGAPADTLVHSEDSTELVQAIAVCPAHDQVCVSYARPTEPLRSRAIDNYMRFILRDTTLYLHMGESIREPEPNAARPPASE